MGEVLPLLLGQHRLALPYEMRRRLAWVSVACQFGSHFRLNMAVCPDFFTMHWFLITFIILLVLKNAKSLWLDMLNERHVRAHAEKMPDIAVGFMSEEEYKKSVAYTLAKSGLGKIEGIYESLILAAVVLSGFFPWFWNVLGNFWGYGIWAQSGFIFVTMLALSIPALPLEYYATFNLEERFGFNKSTLGLWIMDKVKGLIIGALIVVPLIALVIKLVDWLGGIWWLVGFVVVFGFQLVMMVLYPKLILPLFNKLKPLEDGELKDELMDLADRSGFKAKTIEVIDGSKRSGHSNAYFTGFGKFRRIVLYDTLIEQLDTDELKAVLAHEIGHYKCGHIPKMVAMAGISLLAAFGIIAYLAKAPWFYGAFGFTGTSSIAPALLLFGLLSGLITSWFTPVFSILSRKHEYEADAFARKVMNGPQSLIGALKKLHQKNLGNLTPHPLYSAFYYSHPTLVEREQALLNGDS